MIPAGFQYFLDDVWNFQNVHQIWTVHLFLYVELLKKTKEYGNILKTYYFSYLNILEIQNFPNRYTTGHQKCGTYLYVIFFRNMVGPKQLAHPNVFA